MTMCRCVRNLHDLEFPPGVYFTPYFADGHAHDGMRKAKFRLDESQP